MRLIFLFCFLLLSFNASAQDKPPLTIIAEEWPSYTNADLTGTYWDIIRAIYGDDYQLNLKTVSWKKALNNVSAKQADIIIGVYRGQRADILIPEYHIDMDSALYILYDDSLHNINSLADLENLTIAGRNHYVSTDILPQSTTFYAVDSVKGINKLIFNQRIDGALVFALDVYSADPSGTLSIKRLTSKRKMYLGFADTPRAQKLMDQFDKKMQQLLAENKIKPLFNEAVYYEFAGFNHREAQPTISLQLITSIYDKHQQTLITTKQDRHTASLLAEELPQYNFDIQLSSVRVVSEEMKNLTASTCVVGFAKKPTRMGSYLFSLPIYTYIKPRLILLEENNSLIPTQALTDNTISIEKLFSAASTFRLASMDNSDAYTALKNVLSTQQYQRIFNIDAGPTKNILALLLAKRIDALVLWPHELSNIIDSTIDVNKLVSYEISESIGNNINTYIACNNTPTNTEFIAAVNSLLQQEKFPDTLFNDLLRRLDPQSAMAFMDRLAISETPEKQR